MNTMTMMKFAEAVRVEIEKKIDKKAVIQRINKNNGIEMYGLTILEAEMNISPTIYVEPYYEMYEAVGMEEIVNSIMHAYELYKPNHSIDVEPFLNFTSVKDKLAVKLINYEKNEEQLKEIPHSRFLDLAIVPVLRLENFIGGQATITVKNNLQETWGVDTEMIIKTALENIRNDVSINSIFDCIGGIEFERKEASDMQELYVMTNSSKLFGASTMLWTDRLRELADVTGKDALTIIPSSIHECLILLEEVEKEEMLGVVEEVNDSIVDTQEILSYNIYKYNRLSDTITIA